ISGSAYGKHLGVVRTNFGFAETSTLSAVAIMCIPLLMHLRRHSLLIPPGRPRALLYIGYSFACCVAAVATYARTAVIGFAVLGLIMWLQSKRKRAMAVALVVVGATLVAVAPDSWKSRIWTIDTYEQDTSAAGRLMVWKWTLEFAITHPLGGGFSSYIG